MNDRPGLVSQDGQTKRMQSRNKYELVPQNVYLVYHGSSPIKGTRMINKRHRLHPVPFACQIYGSSNGVSKEESFNHNVNYNLSFCKFAEVDVDDLRGLLEFTVNDMTIYSVSVH